MRNLLAFIVKYNHWFVFLVLEIISLVLLFQYNSYQGSVWFSSANAVNGKMYEASSKMESYFALTTLNEGLTKRNIELEQQVAQLKEQLADVKSQSTPNHQPTLDSISTLKLIPAKVVSNEVTKANNLITIDKGARDGVKKDMGVVCGTGIVGIVYMVSSRYSIVIPVINSRSSISCSIDDSGYFGYLHWTGGHSTVAFLDDIPRHAHFKLYDKVVTSGYSSVFPKGIMVGKILHVYNSPDGLSYRAMVELSTNFSRLRDVCVINDTGIDERLQLLRAAQDSIKPQNND